ncbi:glutathione binding-like protein [Synechococcus sp. PCC 7335]|uniref:glutathione binding-like protein n=1 Tax=Synechococcus sp. (strain ATCC 29403 / PCC 7335) TaxID=91464 RepID=UPI000312329B|nr:glutathione binding-like protein [Synechococcus sp. PCC 7335]
MTKKWPVQYPDRIQLYSLGTPNGQKAAVALEEMALPYEAHRVDIMEGDQFTDEFVTINPNSKIPAIVDPNGPNGEPLAVFESGAILIYLAEKSGKCLPPDPAARSECLQWLFFQVGGVGPMFGQFGHFYKYAKEKIPYGIERYQTEVKRLLGVLEKRLQERDFLVGAEYTIADIATFPWVGCLVWGYKAAEILELESFPAVMAWYDRCAKRPASVRGLEVTK